MDGSNGEDASNWRVDFDGDGVDDATAFDRGSDGVADGLVLDDAEGGRIAFLDVDGDSVMDAELIDIDDDGVFDGAIADVDGDQYFETDLVRRADGSFTPIDLPDEPSNESTQPVPSADTPSDGRPDARPPTLDPDSDPTSDDDVVLVPVTPEEPTEPTRAQDPVDTGPATDSMAGDPENDAMRWFDQVDNGLCMPASVTQIVVEMTNGQFTFEQVQTMAIENGWISRSENEIFMTDKGYGWSGMTTADGERLLEAFGVNAEIVHGVTPTDLAAMLEGGYDIIATIDGEEIWTGLDDDVTDFGTGSNHALVVTGVDIGRGVVVVNDPGDPNGRAHEYPLDMFLDAWADSGFEAIVATPPVGTVMDDAPHGAIDLVDSDSPGAVLLPVVLDHHRLVDAGTWR